MQETIEFVDNNSVFPIILDNFLEPVFCINYEVAEETLKNFGNMKLLGYPEILYIPLGCKEKQ